MRAPYAHCTVTLALLLACGGKTDTREMDRSDLVRAPNVVDSEHADALDTPEVTSANTPRGLDAELGAGVGESSLTPSEPGMAASSSPSEGNTLSTQAAADSIADEGADDEAQDATQESTVVTSSFKASDVPADGNCRVWLDAPGSPLLPEDLTVSFDGETWLDTDDCSPPPEWYLYKDDAGLWLSMCPSACDVLAATPTGTLTVEAVYWTEVANGVAR